MSAACQDCGPVRHFREREREGTLGDLTRCARCGRQLQPLSSDEVAQMRRGMALLERSHRRDIGPTSGPGWPE